MKETEKVATLMMRFTIFGSVIENNGIKLN